MKKVSLLVKHPKKFIAGFFYKYGGFLPDKIYLKSEFYYLMGYHLNLKNPKTFAEKLQWLKLYDRKTVYHQMVDKVEAKSFIDEKIGKGYTIPTLGVFDSFEQIDWDRLPQQFILKATHDSGSYFIVKDKKTIDRQKCKKQLYVNWNKDFYKANREWQYKGLKSRLIAEPLIADPKELREYKFFCFDGEPKMFQTCYDRDNSLGGAILNFYNMDCELLDLHDKGHSRFSEVKIKKPTNYEKMIQFSKVLSNDMHFLRVDFYEVENQLFCGELTLQENAGFCAFTPEHWNYDLGDWLHLPIEKIDK